MLNKAVFINLDNTLVKTRSGKEYFDNVEDWEFVSGILPKLKTLVNNGHIPCIVSNQGGVGTGKVLESDVLNRMRSVEKELAQYLGADVHSAYCIHLESYYRKPNPGMAYYFAIELSLSLRDSIMIGTTKSDSGFAKMAYIGTYYDLDDFLKTDITEEI